MRSIRREFIGIEISKVKTGEVWVSDLTYIKHRFRFIYMVVIQDVRSKEVVEYSIGLRHDSELASKAIKEVIEGKNIYQKDA